MCGSSSLWSWFYFTACFARCNKDQIQAFSYLKQCRIYTFYWNESWTTGMLRSVHKGIVQWWYKIQFICTKREFCRYVVCSFLFRWVTINFTKVEIQERRGKGCAAADYQDLWLQACSTQEHMTQGVITLRTFFWLYMKSLRKNLLGMTLRSIQLKCSLYIL